MRLVFSKFSILSILFISFFLFSVLSYTYEVQARPEWAKSLLFVRWGVGLVFCLLCMCFSKNALPYFFLFGLVIVLSILGEREHVSYFGLLLFAYAVSEQKDVHIQRFFLKAAFSSFLMICLVFFLSAVGFIQGKIFTNTLGFAFEVRDALGFYNPNPASLLLLSGVIVFLVFDKYLMFFLTMFMFWLSQVWLGSRTYIAVSLLVFVLFFVRKRIATLRLACVTLILVLATFPILVMWVMDNLDFELYGVNVNALLSDRLYVIKKAFENAGGLSLFSSEGFITVDPGFINLLGYIGVLPYYLFLILLLFVSFKVHSGVLIIAMIAFILANFTENAISPYNFASLLFFVVIFKSLKIVTSAREMKIENNSF